jgi:hypothetical protein
MGLYGFLRVNLYFLYVDYVLISQETRVYGFMICYKYNFTFAFFYYVLELCLYSVNVFIA